MGEVSARIDLKQKDDGFGWTYVQWTINFGKGKEAIREDVPIKCAETSHRYLSRQEALDEAKHRIRLKIQKECGDFPEEDVHWMAID